MLALFLMIEPSVSLTPKSFTPPPPPPAPEEQEEAPPPRDGHVRELWPLLLQCEQRRVIAIDSTRPGVSDHKSSIRDREARIRDCVSVLSGRGGRRKRFYLGREGGGAKWGDCGLEIKRRDQKDAVVVLLIYCRGEMTVVSPFWDNVLTFERGLFPGSWLVLALCFFFFLW